MPKDLITPSQQWNVQDQFEQSKIINAQNEQDKLKKLQNEQDFNSLAEKEQKAWAKLKQYEADGYDMSMHYDKFKTIGADSGKVERAYNGFRKFTSEGATTLSNILNEDDSQYRNNVREVKLREDNWKQRQSELNPNEYKTKEDVWNVAGGVGEATPYVAGGFAMGVSKAPTFLGKLAGDIGRGAVADAYLGTLQHGYKENFDSEIAKEVGLGVAGQTVGTGLAHLLSKVGVGDVLTPKNPQTEVTDKINKEYASSSVENKVGDSISSSDNITPDSVAKKINDIYFGGKNIIEDTQSVRSDMPVIDNQQANKVNDFFNPVDKNRVQAQGNGSLPTPASQQDPFVYQPKQADTFGFEKDAQRNNELQLLREKISPLNDVLKINETKSLMGVKRENPNDISLPPMGTQKQLLPDVLPLDNKEEMKSIIRYAKDNNAVDEFISKLPPNKRVDEVQKFFDNLKPTQQKQDGIIQVRTNIKEPIVKDIPTNEQSLLNMEAPKSTKFQQKEMIVNGETINKTDFDLIQAYQNTRAWNRNNPNNKRPILPNQKDAYLRHSNIADDLKNIDFNTNAKEPTQRMYEPTIDDAVANNMDYETANRMGAIPFSNGSQIFGGAAVGGTHAIATGQDYNNDGKADYKDGLIGALIGAVGVKTARKIMPNAFKDKNIDRNTVGMFINKNPIDTIRVKNQDIKANLKEWHKDSSLETKNKDGGPIVFYHGTSSNFDEFNPRADKNFKGYSFGINFSDDQNIANNYAKNFKDKSSNGTNMMPVYLNIKNPLILKSEEKYATSIIDDGKKEIIRKILDSRKNKNPYDGVIAIGKDGKKNTVVFESTQIKSVNNKGVFDSSNPNILMASPTIGGGLAGGVVGATNDLNGDSKTNLKDILIGVGLGAGGTKGYLLAKNTNIVNKAKSIIKEIGDTETADKALGHKIYQKTDYMALREAMISNKNKQYESFALLHEQLKLLDDTTRTKMYDYMSGNKTIQLSPNIKQLADNYTGEINKMGKELVDLGVLEEAQFDKFKDRYLHRRYEKDFSQKFNSLFTKGKTIQGVHARGNEWNGTKTEYEKLLNDGKIGDFFDGKIEATRMQNGQYKFRQDWTEEQRTRWGEVKDIAFSLPETLMRTREMIDHATMLKKIIDETGYVSNDALDGYEHLAGKRFGALNGKYVPADMKLDIVEFNNALFGNDGKFLGSKAGEVFKELSTFWKKSHTVYNPIAHLNNLVSNVTMQFGAGINPNKAVTNAYKGALASQKVNQLRELTAKKIIGLSQEENVSLKALSQDEDLKLWNQAQQAGLFGRSNLNDILNKYVNPSNTSMSTNKFKNGLQKVDELASSMYQGEDNIMRFSMIKSLTEDGLSFDAAFKKVNETIPDYTKPMSKWARFGRDSMLTPFISWTYYATPIILKQMKERPERIAAIYGALYGINQIAGIDPFNEKDIPQQNFSMKRIPIYKNGDEVTTIKVDRWIPHGDILSPLDFVKNLTSGGAWVGGQDVLRNRNSYFGGKITNNEGALKAYDLTKYAVEQITPDALDNVYNLAESKIMSKEKRTKNPVMQPRTTAQELIKMFGINSMTYNKANQAKEVEKQKLNKLKKDKED